jgi:hypothetical protein
MFCNPRQLKKYQIHGIRLIEGIWKMRQTTGDDHEVCYPKRGIFLNFQNFSDGGIWIFHIFQSKQPSTRPIII